MAGIGANEAWEYLMPPEADQARLSALGKEGWELVAVGNSPEGSPLYFKRRLPSFREMVTLEQRRAYYASLERQAQETE